MDLQRKPGLGKQNGPEAESRNNETKDLENGGETKQKPLGGWTWLWCSPSGNLQKGSQHPVIRKPIRSPKKSHSRVEEEHSTVTSWKC